MENSQTVSQRLADQKGIIINNVWFSDLEILKTCEPVNQECVQREHL